MGAKPDLVSGRKLYLAAVATLQNFYRGKSLCAAHSLGRLAVAAMKEMREGPRLALNCLRPEPAPPIPTKQL